MATVCLHIDKCRLSDQRGKGLFILCQAFDIEVALVVQVRTMIKEARIG